MRRVVLGVLMALAATVARAEEKLLTGPAPAWVKAGAPIAAQPLPEAGMPMRYLRLDRQLHFGPEGDSVYQESVAQIRTAMGLQYAGTQTISWDPKDDTLTVHKLRIIRGDQTIDLLAKQSFTIIRREPELAEIVDGRLTATLQPEDLRVGDLVEMAYTVVRHDPVMKGRTDLAFNLGADARMVHELRLRATWPTSKPVAWRAGDGLPKPKLVKHGGETEFTLDLVDPVELKGPSGAPRRYWPTRDVEFSEFPTWGDVAANVAPQFAKAMVLAPDSPLKAEAASIRARSDDPKVRAAAALKLVQDQVRYLGLTLADGGYTPVDADKTWARRFGECKAKAVLLAALLHELGIEAEPALVNAYGDEDMDKSLPRMSAFNHVITRVVIAGEVYWLDGTKTGDGVLDPLNVPGHDWALPIRAQGATLVALVQPPLTRPNGETSLEIDATAGIEAPAPVKGEMVMRGDAGLWPGLMLSNMPAADRDKMLKAMWSRYPWIEVKTATATRDPATGVSRMVMTGTAKLRWLSAPNGARWFFVPDAGLGYRAEFKREPDQDAKAPFAAPYPMYTASRFTLKLPYGGDGFSTPAPDVDKTVAARAWMRRTTFAKGVVTIESSTRSVAPEFPAAEAPAAAAALTEMADTRVVIQAPRVYHATAADIAAYQAETPKTATEFMDRGGRLMRAGRNAEGLADFEKAITLDPKSAWAYADRGLARIQMGQYDLAKPDLDQAIKLDPRNPAVQGALGSLAMRDGRYAEAVTMFTRAADLSPNNFWAVGRRAAAHYALGEIDLALADWDEVLQMDPKLIEARVARAEIYASLGQLENALKEADAALPLAPNEPHIQAFRGAILMKLGRQEDADKAFAASLSLRPNIEAYLTRAAYRPKTDLKGRLADIDAAEKLEPGNPQGQRIRAEAYLDAGQPAEAIAVLTHAIKAKPEFAWALLPARARAYSKAGQGALAAKDFGELRVKASGNTEALNNLCWTQATLGIELEAALADCQAALKIAPKSPHIVDSEAFVLLRLGRAKESLDVYEEAVRLRPKQAQSIYGRGLAKLKMGMTAEGLADLAAARAIFAGVDDEFAGYGMKP